MEYTLIRQENPYSAHIMFTGMFDENEVTWDTHFLTLEEFIRQNPGTQEQKQFIEISQQGDKKMTLTVVLNVPEITSPAIAKMIIMIRQYKRLKIGKHEYGPPLNLEKS